VSGFACLTDERNLKLQVVVSRSVLLFSKDTTVNCTKLLPGPSSATISASACTRVHLSEHPRLGFQLDIQRCGQNCLERLQVDINQLISKVSNKVVLGLSLEVVSKSSFTIVTKILHSKNASRRFSRNSPGV